MRFAYGDAFKASRYTGYEVMLYSCSHGDATLFSRGDLVEAAWQRGAAAAGLLGGDAGGLPELRRAAAGARRRPPT